MEKKGKREVSKNKNKLIPKITKKSNFKKEKTVTTTLKDSKRIIQESKENLKSKNKQKIFISNKKYSMDNRETIPNTNSNTNSNSHTNNITDSSGILIDKKKILKTEIINKKVNLKTKYNKNPEEKTEKNLNIKDYNINPFLINSKQNNNNFNKININSTTKEKENDKEKEKEYNSNKKEEKRIINDGIKRQRYNKDDLDLMEFSFDKKLENTREGKDKDKENIYKNRFLTKINKNNSKERKTEGSFGSIIHQKKLKLFSFVNDQNNNNSNNFTINMKESTIGSISSKNIIHEQGLKESKLLTEIKDGLKKMPEKKKQASGKKQDRIEKKISYIKLNRFDYNEKKNCLDSNNSHKEAKEILKLEAKINKNREILFNSKGKIPKEKIKEKNKNNFQLLFPKIKPKYKNHRTNLQDSNNNTTKNTQRINTAKMTKEKRITYNPLHQSNLGNKTFNSPKNQKKLLNSNSSQSKNKLEDKTLLKELETDKAEKKEKAINFKKNLSPVKIDINLNDEKENNNENLEKPFMLSSERDSSFNKDAPIYSILKDNNKNSDNLYSMETIFLSNRFSDLNKSPQIKRKENDNKILRTKTEIQEIDGKSKKINKLNNDNNVKNNEININLNLEKLNSKDTKDNQKHKNSKNAKTVSNEKIFTPLNTLDNESFKKSTVKKLIKNNQYKALLSQMAAVKIHKHKDKERDKEKEKIKEKENLKIKKKFRFSERRRGSHVEEPNRKLTESSENYYNLYKKAFNDSNNLEQKFSFRPKSKNKNMHYKYNKNKDKDNEEDKILNKKESTISFTSKQKQILDSEINLEDINYHKNVLSNSSDRSKIYDKEEEIDNKNFILDLNHFIPIDENKLIDTISKPLFRKEK